MEETYHVLTGTELKERARETLYLVTTLMLSLSTLMYVLVDHVVSQTPRVIRTATYVSEVQPPIDAEYLSAEFPERVTEASEPIVEHPVLTYHDTRQILNGDFDITKKSNLTVSDITKMLSGPRSKLQTEAQAIYDAEQKYGINALYLTALFGYESGWGKYSTGTNNIAGWKGGPGGTWSNFDSRYDCIMTVTKGLYESFVLTQGPRLERIVERYCPEEGYINNILTIMGNLESQL